MNEAISNASAILKLAESCVGLVFAVVVIVWVYRLWRQRRKDALNEITFEGKQISIKVDSESLADLVANSNKEHGASTSGNDSEEK